MKGQRGSAGHTPEAPASLGRRWSTETLTCPQCKATISRAQWAIVEFGRCVPQCPNGCDVAAQLMGASLGPVADTPPEPGKRRRNGPYLGKRRPPVIPPKACGAGTKHVGCGVVYTPKSNKSGYCPACQKIVRDAQNGKGYARRELARRREAQGLERASA